MPKLDARNCDLLCFAGFDFALAAPRPSRCRACICDLAQSTGENCCLIGVNLLLRRPVSWYFPLLGAPPGALGAVSPPGMRTGAATMIASHMCAAQRGVSLARAGVCRGVTTHARGLRSRTRGAPSARMADARRGSGLQALPRLAEGELPYGRAFGPRRGGGGIAAVGGLALPCCSPMCVVDCAEARRTHSQQRSRQQRGSGGQLLMPQA